MRIAPMRLVLAGALALWSLSGAPGRAAVKPEASVPSRVSSRTAVTAKAAAVDSGRPSDGARAGKVIRTLESDPAGAEGAETVIPETAPEPGDVAPSPAEALKPAGPTRVKWLSPRSHGVLFRPGTATLEWSSTFPGATFYTVTLSRDGRNFGQVVAPWQSATRARWTPPAQNRTDFFLRVKAMDADGRMLDDDVIPVHVLPENAIVISKENQALWAFEDGRLRHRFTISTGTKETETRAGWFAVYNRVEYHHSSLYDAPMPFSLFFSGGMAIHASGYIKEMGTPASHGCVRVRLVEARKLYADSPVGRPVIVTEWGRDMSYLDATAEPPAEMRTARRDPAAKDRAEPASVPLTPIAAR